MATESQEPTPAEDISEDGQQEEQQAPTSDTEGNGEQQPPAPQVTKDTKLPDDHPVVKQLAADKAKLAKAHAELAELRAKSADVTRLETELAARPTSEALATLQTRYDRLEGFLLAAGGNVAKALDSRTFTRDLFETDKDIESLVKDWNKANPSATSQALGVSGGEGKKSSSMNDLLRAAASGLK